MLLHVINMTKGSDFIILSCDPTYVLVDITLYVVVIPLRCTTAWNSGGLFKSSSLTNLGSCRENVSGILNT